MERWHTHSAAMLWETDKVELVQIGNNEEEEALVDGELEEDEDNDDVAKIAVPDKEAGERDFNLKPFIMQMKSDSNRELLQTIPQSSESVSQQEWKSWKSVANVQHDQELQEGTPCDWKE